VDFDDDETGEAADVIAIRVESDRLIVRFLHCKYSHGANPGARVSDLYEVCGQAQRSVYWKGQPEELIAHMLHRESRRVTRGGVSRFERGNAKQLKAIGKRTRFLRAHLEIAIVQPGLLRAAAESRKLAGASAYGRLDSHGRKRFEPSARKASLTAMGVRRSLP
jgi:hypothetical protein